jgi:Tfp pilus assembly protein PilZ
MAAEAASGIEKRRSPRHPIELPVELIEGKRTRLVRTVDVSRHGLFLATDEPPRERYLIQLSVKLPTGPLPATAFVSRTVSPSSGRRAGVGVQFFALSASSKERWDAFVFDLAGLKPPPQATSELAKRTPDGATFLIKLKDTERLLEFYEKNVARGGLYMATPVIKESGAEVALVVIHPDTEHELILTGKVVRVCTDAPKGMEIKLATPNAERARFLEFVTTGQGPSADAKPVDHRKKIDALPTITGDEIDTEDLSIDIVVDEAAVDDSEQFVWEDVPNPDGVLTFDITEYEEFESEHNTLDIVEEEPRDFPEVDLGFHPPRRSPTADLVPVELSEVGGSIDLPQPRPRDATVIPAGTEAPRRAPTLDLPLAISVACEACCTEFGTLDLGPIEGPIGLIASRRPFWCPKDQRLVAIARLDPAGERRAKKDKADGQEAPVASSDLFAIADMSGPPTCACGTKARVDALAKALSERLGALAIERRMTLDLECRSCGEKRIVVEAR